LSSLDLNLVKTYCVYGVGPFELTVK